MKPLPTNFRDGNYDFTLVNRQRDIALAENKHGYIVFRVRKYADRTIMDNFSPAHEAVPPAESWGDEGWTYTGIPDKSHLLKMAQEKFAAEFNREPNSPILGVPTGGQRGRVRANFELDVSGFTGTFLFSDIVNANEGVDQPMLRNRLKSLIDAGTVKVVDTIKGGVGRAKNVYQVV